MSEPRIRTLESQVAALCEGRAPGTAEIVTRVLLDGAYGRGWRFLRSAIDHAQKRAPHMTPEQFTAWMNSARIPGKRVQPPQPADILELSRRQRSEHSRGEREIPISLALACAHQHMGFVEPCSREPAEFDRWFVEAFGQTARICEYLDLDDRVVNDRRRGFGIRPEGRVERTVEPVLLRALDWVASVGPFNPWSYRGVS